MRSLHDLGGTAGQRRARARARNPTWSAERRASPSLGTQVPHACWVRPTCEIDREPRSAVVRNERKAAVTALRSREATARRSQACSRTLRERVRRAERVPRKHPSAIGAPPTPHRGGNSTEPGRKGAPREGKEMARSRREDGKSRGRTCRQRQRGRSRHSRLAVGWRRAPPGRDHARLRAYAEG